MTTKTNNSPSGRKVSLKGTIALASVAIAATATATVTAAFTGAAVGDIVSMSPRAALGTGVVLSSAYVSAAGVLTVLLANVGAAVTPAAATYDCLITKV